MTFTTERPQRFLIPRLVVVLPLLFTCGLFSSLASPAHANEIPVIVHLDSETVTVDEPVTVHASWKGKPLAGALISVETRPSSQIARTHTVGTLSERGELRWTPELAGLVRMRVLDPSGKEELGQRDLAVRYPGLPLSALVVLIGAGGLLFGGIWIGFGRQMGES